MPQPTKRAYDVGSKKVKRLKRGKMDYINRIELLGRVGNVRTNIVGETMVANISLVTEHLYKTRDGRAVNEVTWHHIVAWAGKEIADLNLIRKGSVLHVSGRVRASKYTTAEGTEKQFSEIAAYKIRILEGEELN